VFDLFFLLAQAGHTVHYAFFACFDESPAAMKIDANMWLCFYAGVIVSTPTGSTAYAAAAGASMIHPNVPAIMVTPICPHSLSFRPIVVPAGVELMVRGTLLLPRFSHLKDYIYKANLRF